MNIPQTKIQKTKARGFTLFVAIVVTATLLLVSTGIISIAVKEAFLTAASRDSQFAFYAADTGTECAIYWDVQNPEGHSAFASSTTDTITCNQDETDNITNPVNPEGGLLLVGGAAQSTFRVTFLPNPYCADVTVTKGDDGSTKIESLGYNSCDTSDTHRVERAVRVSY